MSDHDANDDLQGMELALRIFLRFLRWLAVTVWFGIFFLAYPVLILSSVIHDPRDIFSNFFSGLGCYMMIGFWLWISISYAIHDEMPYDV